MCLFVCFGDGEVADHTVVSPRGLFCVLWGLAPEVSGDPLVGAAISCAAVGCGDLDAGDLACERHGGNRREKSGSQHTELLTP